MGTTLKTTDFDDVEFLLRASKETSVVSNTYFPSFSSKKEVVEWLAEEENSFVILEDGEPVGAISIHAKVNKGGAQLALPRDSREIEIWLMPVARGRGIAQRAHSELLTRFHDRCPLVSIIWSENESSIRLFSSLGYEHVADIHWTGPDGQGPCWVGILDPSHWSLSTQK